MEKVIKTYDISYFAYLNQPAVYADDNYFVVAPAEQYPELTGNIRIGCLLILFCLQGNVQLSLNNETFHLATGDCIICPPYAIISRLEIAENTITSMVGYSIESVASMLIGGEDMWHLFALLAKKPIINNTQRYIYQRMDYFLSILRYRTCNNDKYQKELCYHLFAMLFFDVLNDFHLPQEQLKAHTPTNRKHYRAEIIYKDFLILLTKDNGLHRDVKYFSDKLFISPKYLSYTVKRFEGKPAQEVLLERAVNRVKSELKYTDTPLQAVSDLFQFENYTAFCKFVKKNLGVSALEYRMGRHR